MATKILSAIKDILKILLSLSFKDMVVNFDIAIGLSGQFFTHFSSSYFGAGFESRLQAKF